jgi:glycosyltransferase involved in cell wall biosynthesis
MLPFVSLIIPTLNEEEYLEQTILSLLSNDYPSNKFEILLIDGLSKDNTLVIAQRLAKKFSNIRLMSNPKIYQSAALNIGIKESKGDFIIRADAHAIYDKNYIRSTIDLLQKNEYSNVGPVQVSIGRTLVEKAIAKAMNSKIGMGNAKYRLDKREVFEVKSVWLGAWKKETLIKINGFNENLPISEDFDLNYRLRRSGSKIAASNSIKAMYLVRKSLKGLFKQFYKYGFWKIKFLMTYPEEFQLRWLAPPILVFALFFSILLVKFISWSIFLPIAYIFILFLITFYFMIKSNSFKDLISSVILCLVFPVIHISWGVGFLYGFFHWNIKKIYQNN